MYIHTYIYIYTHIYIHIFKRKKKLNISTQINYTYKQANKKIHKNCTRKKYEIELTV